MTAKESNDQSRTVRLLRLSPLSSFLSLVCLHLYIVCHSWHKSPDWHTESWGERISLVLPIDAWKLLSVLLAIAAIGLVLFGWHAPVSGWLKFVALAFGILACLTVPLIV